MKRLEGETNSIEAQGATTLALELLGDSLQDSENKLAVALRELGRVDGPTVAIPSLGFDVVLDDDRVIRSIHLHAAGHEGYRAFPFKWNGLDFSSSRAEVLSRLGPPVNSGQPSSSEFLGPSGAWDKFQHGEIFVHFQYRLESDSIVMVTLSEASSELARPPLSAGIGV